jgi:hypothetical protein
MATPNPVRGADGLRELTGGADRFQHLGRGNKKGPSREGPFLWFQSGAYCTITFLVWMLRPSVTVNKYVPRGMSPTDNTVVP